MFDHLASVGKEIHIEIVKLYWLLIVPLVLILIIIEFLKDTEKGPNVGRILKRAVISMIMLYSFDLVLETIAMVGDGITDKIGGMANFMEVMKNMGPAEESSSGSLFNLRETFIYLFNLAAYVIAYLGFFVAVALIHFVWTILYICSPLMIMMYISENTAFVTKNLYKGLISVVLWKILWSILAALLLKLAMEPKMSGMDDFLASIIVNLFVGISMLLIPLATKSLINNGMGQAATALAAAPAFAAGGVIKAQLSRLGKKTAGGALKGMGTMAKPITNPIAGRFEMLKNKLSPRVEKLKNSYTNLNLPKELKKQNPNLRSKSHYGNKYQR